MIQQSPLITAEETSDDTIVDSSLRPQSLAEYLGQTAVHEQMGIFIDAARRRSESLDHVLIFGPPGLGKNDSGTCHSK
jgi:Holliday junction DNA helicase RuvB